MEQKVLNALPRMTEMSALDIQRAIQRKSLFGLGPLLGTVYVALYRLEQEGRVTSRWIEGPYPRTRVYRQATKDAADEVER